MTTEEKAKAYEMALEAAREELKQDLHESGVWAIKRIFPQLRESEDERIRKCLIHYLRGEEDECEFNIPDMLAWLEKQKEPSDPEERMNHPLYLEGFDVGRRVGQVEAENNSEKCRDCKEYDIGFERGRLEGVTVGYNKAMKEMEQKEQKPCGCVNVESEYDRGWRDGHGAGLKDAEMQNPAEWNDADMKEARENLITCCRDWERGEQTTLLPIVAVRARYFLEHLTEQKPVEWSEEEIEEMVTKRSRSTGTTKSEMAFYRNGIKDAIKRFGLHPSWKPSEEQMEALRKAVNKLANTDVADSVRLSIMYDNLKKL